MSPVNFLNGKNYISIYLKIVESIYVELLGTNVLLIQYTLVLLHQPVKPW